MPQNEKMLQAGPLLSLSPSFNSYSSSAGNLAEIAARVVSELRRESQNAAVFLYDDDDEDQPWPLHGDQYHDHDLYRSERSEPSVDGEDDDDNDDHEFEFAFVGRESASSPISADEIFLNGQIRPVYPLFGKSLLRAEETKENPRNDDVDHVVKVDSERNDETALPPPPAAAAPRRRQPLRKLMVEEEREAAAAAAGASCSSSEADELDGLKDGTYCVWRPGNNGGGRGGGERKKSKSTGTVSRRWTFRGLLLSRSNSDDGKAAAGDGNDKDGAPAAAAEFLVAAARRPGGDSKRVSKGDKAAGKGTGAAVAEEEEKKRSFVPYKQELVGFLANVNGLSRNLHPF